MKNKVTFYAILIIISLFILEAMFCIKMRKIDISKFKRTELIYISNITLKLSFLNNKGCRQNPMGDYFISGYINNDKI